jgi:alkanesulfonate monooxygenase SsuD/methylene tetrahydromethanopterin reductase-like flavin-dependent oxidoreductase (luciferase family)
MNKARLAGVAGIAFVMTAPVHAADLGVRPVYRGPPPVAVVFSHGPAAISEAMRAGDGLTRRYPFRR